MASVVKIRRSSVQGKAPTVEQLQLGELALNTADGKLFSSTGSAIFEVGANTSVANIGTLTVGNTSPFTFPTSDGSSGQVLKTDGSGTLYWSADTASVSNTGAVAQSATSDSSFNEFNYIASNGQITFSGNDNSNTPLSYNPDKIIVFLNGVRLAKDTDYFANNGTTIVLDDPTRQNDVVDVHTYLDVENELHRNNSSHNSNTCYTTSIDSWSASEYRSAKYIVQIEDANPEGSEFEVREILVVQNNNRAYFTECCTVSTAGDTRVAYIGTRVVNDTVHLLVTPTMGSSMNINLVRISLS